MSRLKSISGLRASTTRLLSALPPGRFREGLAKLRQALVLHDRLPEAVYNLILYKLRSGLFSSARILLMIDMAMVDSSVADHLAILKSQVRKIKGKGQQTLIPLPSFLLCCAP